VKASVPKLFFCPGSASYTPVTQGSRWRVASRQLRKPTTPSALAFFVVDRASSGFPFSCAFQNPITPFTPPLPTRPLFPKNTDPQRLSTAALTLTNAPRFPNGKAFQTRKKAIHSRNKAMQRPEIPPLPAMLSALSDRFPRGLTKTDAIALRPRAAG
jgi:hypothetical protein